MENGSDSIQRRRWIPWSREKDEKAKLYGGILSAFIVGILGNTGLLRVDKLGYSDFKLELAEERKEIASEIEHATELTEAGIKVYISERTAACLELRRDLENQIKGITGVDAAIREAVSVNREDTHILRNALIRLEKTVHDYQRRPMQ